MPNLRPLGRRVQHDPRSLAYGYKADRSATYQTVMHAPTIQLDQGQVGSCVGNASAQCLSTKEFGSLPLTEADARDRIYHLATELDDVDGTYPPTDSGSSGLAGAKACQQLGYISGYTHILKVADGLAALQASAIITGVDWYDSFDEPDASGLVSISRGAQVRGGHEFVVIGYDADKGLVWAQNSWGAGWGLNGRFCFTVGTWTQLLANDGDATVFAPKSQPPPTPDPSKAADANLAAAFKAWEPGVLSKVTKAGKLRVEGDAWLQAHGY